MKTTLVTILLVSVTITSFCELAYASRAKVQGEYCYQYGDSESLMIAKEISYAMALRKAIETYKTFVSSTSIVKDFKLKKDIIEAIASGYVDDIKIIKQDVDGRTVCTTLIGYVNPEAVKSVISRKVQKVRKTKRHEFEGLLSNGYIKILNYRSRKEGYPPKVLSLSILYQIGNGAYTPARLIVDCFDKNGNTMEGRSVDIYGVRSSNGRKLFRGEVRRKEIRLPDGTASFELRLVDCR